MKRFCSAFSLCAGLLVLSGCSGTLPVTYTAQSAIRSTGPVELGAVTYIPADRMQVKPNQIRNTAAGSIYVDADVKDIVRRAFTAELDKAGFRPSPSGLVLNCGIDDFLADDLGYSVDWLLRMTCEFIPKSGGAAPIKVPSVEAKKHAGKFESKETHGRQITSLITEAFERIFSDGSVREGISRAEQSSAREAR